MSPPVVDSYNLLGFKLMGNYELWAYALTDSVQN
jgi:hypothetical protein